MAGEFYLGADVGVKSLTLLMKEKKMPYGLVMNPTEQPAEFEPALAALKKEWQCTADVRCIEYATGGESSSIAVVTTDAAHDPLRTAVVLCNSTSRFGHPWFSTRKKRGDWLQTYTTFTGFLSDELVRAVAHRGQKFWKFTKVMESNKPLWFGAGRPHHTTGGVVKYAEEDGMFVDPFTTFFIGKMQENLLLTDESLAAYRADPKVKPVPLCNPDLFPIRAISVMQPCCDRVCTHPPGEAFKDCNVTFLVQEVPPQKQTHDHYEQLMDLFMECARDAKGAPYLPDLPV
jgi:hypothetical protein